MVATSHLMFKGNVAITKQLNRNEAYLSPESIDFEGKTDVGDKGSYTISNGNDINIEGNITANYNNNFFEKLYLSVGVGLRIADFTFFFGRICSHRFFE